jgi:glycerate kinase
MKKILIAPNSFKGCSDSLTIAKYLKKYLNDLKDYQIILKPISDGGDGFLNVCSENFYLKELHYFISTPYDETQFKCSTGYDERNKIIYVESAKVLGLNLIPCKNKNLLLLNSKGLGDLMKQILRDIGNGKINVEEIIIGIGGTGTNDLGLGAVSRFGLKLYDDSGNGLEPIPKNYAGVKHLERNENDVPLKISCIIDVENPLLGENGASRCFAGQKGANQGDIEIMEEGFSNIVNIFQKEGLIKNDQILSGAGGGLAAGLAVFLNAKIINAEDFILKHLELGKYKNKIDYLITGEGSFDSQTMMKKGAWIVLQNFQKSAKKIFLCCGTIASEVKAKLDPQVIPVELIKFFSNKEESIKNVEKGIESACLEIKKILLPNEQGNTSF